MFKNIKGFTLVEMLIVLVVISVLILLIIPNLAGRSADIQDKGCLALKQVVQSQINAYTLDKGTAPTNLGALVSADYISNDQLTCQNGAVLEYNNGKVNH